MDTKLTGSQTALINAAKELKLDCLFGSQATVNIAFNSLDIWQFESGTQGSLRQVAKYTGPVLEIDMPIIRREGCTSGIVVMEKMMFVLIGNKLREVDTVRMQVSLPSGVLKDRTELEAKIANLKKELREAEQALAVTG